MTVIMPFGRSISQHILGRSHHALTRLSAPTALWRVSYSVQGKSNSRPVSNPSKPKFVRLLSVRTYATAKGDRAAGRPKAHSGKGTAKKTGKKTAKKTTKVPKKSKKKSVKKVKSKAKPKRKAPSATALKAQARAERKDLKAKALLDEPKKLPENAWAVYFSENRIQKASKFSDTASHTRQVAADYKTLSPLERERLNHTANENKTTNENNYKQWLSAFTPLQIKEANTARKQLAALKKTATNSKRAAVSLIKDSRLVKQPTTAYSIFNTERFASGDFKNMTLKEAAKLIAGEWKNLSSSSKQVYYDQSKQNQLRYAEEYESVYGEKPYIAKRGKTT